jgi:hypothetical protein
MDIPSKHVYEALKANKVDSIYHANSVITACQYLRSAALLSRGAVERRGLYQTPQKTDETDQKYSLWFDVFLDSVDLHAAAHNTNVYGPVLFKFDAKLIKDAYTGRVWVTRSNPMYWPRITSRGKRWFESSKDLKAEFKRSDFAQMILLRHSGGELPFGKYLQEIIVDDPQVKTLTKIDYYSMAYGALTLAKTEGGVTAPLRKRKCATDCNCLKRYKANFQRSRELFFPKI